MSWLYLLIASLFEMGWPFGLKMAHLSDSKFIWFSFAIIAMILSGYFLYLAQKNIPIGTAYAIWTGIGTIGTFFIGISLFQDNASVARFIGVFLIISGIVVLKVCN